jgi:hypothetical protein
MSGLAPSASWALTTIGVTITGAPAIADGLGALATSVLFSKQIQSAKIVLSEFINA